MCAVLEISRRTYYKYRNADDPDYLDYLMIKNVFKKSKGTYGYRRITEGLKIEYGVIYNHKKVARIMKKYYLKPEYIKRIRPSNYKRIEENVQPNVLKRDFKADKPNQKWATDVTEFKVNNDKLYLSPIVDLFNGEVVSYNLSRHPVFHQVVDMLEKAFNKIPDNTNLILHSDQGWQYQMKQYQYLLEQKGIRQSMSRKGNCLDNACAENFFGVLKSELYYIKEKEYKNIEELENDIIEYIEYYNNRRIKSKLKGMSPVQYREHSKLVA